MKLRFMYEKIYMEVGFYDEKACGSNIWREVSGT